MFRSKHTPLRVSNLLVITTMKEAHFLINMIEGFSLIGRAAYQSEGHSMFGRTAQSECRIFNDWTNCPISVKDFHLRGRISNQSVGLSMIGDELPNQSKGFSMIGRTAQSECRIVNDWTNCPIRVKYFE